MSTRANVGVWFIVAGVLMFGMCRDKAPDPDSPFAKLMALKAQLEERDRDKR